MLKRKKQSILFHAQWWASLLLYTIFSHSVSALIVDFSTTPSSGPVPLFVTLSVYNKASPSPGFYLNNFQWEVTGPETIQVPGIPDVVIPLKKEGEYTIKLTLTEFALQVDPNTGIASIPVTNTDFKTKTVTVLPVGSEPTTQTPTQTQTPTSTQQIPSSTQPIDFTNPFTQTPTTQTPTTQTTTTQTPTTTIPVPSFTVSPSSGQAPLTVNLSVDSPSSTLTYNWKNNFLSGPTTAPAIPPGSSSRVTLTQAGNYSVTVTATDNQGSSSESDPKIIEVLSSGVVVPNPNQNQTTTTPPEANFTATPNSNFAPVTVTLDGSLSRASSGRTISSYQWQSGEGQFKNGQTTSIIYQQPGTYTIGLTVRDSAGSPSTMTTKTITVNKAQVSAPQASFTTTPETGFAPLTVNLDGSQSTSPSGTITSYQWQSGDGQNKNGQTTSMTYNQAGTYTISLIVTDSSNLSSTPTTQTIVVNEAPVPTARFTATPTTGFAPLTVTLDGSQSTSTSGTITSYQWQSGDGQDKNGQTTPMTYNQAGTYTISLTVTDSSGSSTPTTQTIVVNEAPVPTARFTAVPTNGPESLTVSLDASNSTGNGITYQWARSDNIPITETGSTVSTTFEKGGTYIITLTITDQSGKQDQDERTISVVPKLKPRFTVATNSALLGSYSLNASNSTVSSNTTYIWKIDDGEKGQGPSLTTTLNEGIHKLELTLSDNFEQSESLGHYIYVPRTQDHPIPLFTMTLEGSNLRLDASNSFDPDGGNIAIYQWTVGGGEIGTGKTILYQPTASTDITLTVTDSDSGSVDESVTAHIAVENGNFVINPVANFHTYDVKVENNKILSTMTFDVSGSFHPDAEKNESLKKPPEWFIGASENNCTPAANQDALEVKIDKTDSVIYNIRFTKGGNYFLCLKVTDEDGREDTKGITVKIANSYADEAPSFNGNQGGQPFKGGVLIKDQFLSKDSAVSNNTFVDIVAELTSVGFPNNGGSIDVYVVVALGNQFYMMDAEIERFRVWNGQPGNLVPAYKEMPFSNGKIHVPIFSGKMQGVIPAGTYQVFVGYDWSELPLDLNRAVYTNDPITFTVVDDSP